MVLPVKTGYFCVPIFSSGAVICSCPPTKSIIAGVIQGGNFKEVPFMRVKVTLRCSECKQRNYNTMKNKKNDPDRLEMNKYCRFCRKHTTHNETK